MDRKSTGIWAAAVGLYGIAFIVSPPFRSPVNLVNIVSAVSVIGLLALGQTVVIICRGLDLSQTAIASLGGLTAAWLVQFGGHSVPEAFVIALIVGLIAGTLNGLIVVNTGLSGFIVTLASYFVFVGFGAVIHAGGIEDITNPGFVWLGTAQLGRIPISVLVFLAVAILVALLMSRTIWGQQVYASGSNPAAARLYGVNVSAVVVSSYAISGLLAALAGVIAASEYNAALQSVATIGAGNNTLLDSFAAVLVGGVSLQGGAGSIVATCGGVFLIGVLDNFMSILGLDATSIQILRGVVLISAAAVYSTHIEVHFPRWIRPAFPTWRKDEDPP